MDRARVTVWRWWELPVAWACFEGWSNRFTKKLRNRAIKDASFQGFTSRPQERWRCQHQDWEQVRGREGEGAGPQLALWGLCGHEKRLPLWADAVGTSRVGWTSAPIPAPWKGIFMYSCRQCSSSGALLWDSVRLHPMRCWLDSWLRLWS